jgi:hypothetical protein
MTHVTTTTFGKTGPIPTSNTLSSLTPIQANVAAIYGSGVVGGVQLGLIAAVIGLL